MENGPFIDDVPIKTSIYEGFSMAMLNHRMVASDQPAVCLTNSRGREPPAILARSCGFGWFLPRANIGTTFSIDNLFETSLHI